jgi:hypothetical protein
MGSLSRPPRSSVSTSARARPGRDRQRAARSRRVDLCLCDERGVEEFRLPDIPVPSGAGSIAFQESIQLAKASPTHTMIARLVALDESGAERLLGEYTFHHTRTLPG